MDGLGQHIEWQAKLAGAKTGQSSQSVQSDDEYPDIGTMVPIEKVSPKEMK